MNLVIIEANTSRGHFLSVQPTFLRSGISHEGRKSKLRSVMSVIYQLPVFLAAPQPLKWQSNRIALGAQSVTSALYVNIFLRRSMEGHLKFYNGWKVQNGWILAHPCQGPVEASMYSSRAVSYKMHCRSLVWRSWVTMSRASWSKNTCNGYTDLSCAKTLLAYSRYVYGCNPSQVARWKDRFGGLGCKVQVVMSEGSIQCWELVLKCFRSSMLCFL